MYATEFQTIAKEPYIKIPEFEKFKDKKIRVVVIDIDKQEEKNDSTDFIEKLIKNPIDFPKDFKFDREEANER